MRPMGPMSLIGSNRLMGSHWSDWSQSVLAFSRSKPRPSHAFTEPAVSGKVALKSADLPVQQDGRLVNQQIRLIGPILTRASQDRRDSCARHPPS